MKQKPEYKTSEILEKIGASPNLVDVAKSLEDMSEAESENTLLGYQDRLSRAALASRLYADPEVKKQMMVERGIRGGLLGAIPGGVLGYGLSGGGSGGTSLGALLGGLAGAGIGAYTGHRKSEEARDILGSAEEQQEVMRDILESLRSGQRADII